MISRNDIDGINKIISQQHEARILKKTASGDRIEIRDEMIIRPRGFEIKNYSGKRLKHRKAYIGEDKTTVTVCDAGDLYDDIPASKKKRVQFSDEDFE